MVETIDDGDESRAFRTLRGFLDCEEPDEETTFCYTASLRIFGQGLPAEEISKALRVLPTHFHRAGEKRGPRSPAYKEDGWIYHPNVPEEHDLPEHIDALWRTVEPSVEYLKALKARFRVDVFLGYRSNCDHAGVEVPYQSLVIFRQLEVPFGLSIVVA